MKKRLCFYWLISLFFIQHVEAKEASNISNPVVAHRGAWKALDLPQNSIASLQNAIELKCRGSEFDVRMTADDSLVVVHDPHHNQLLVDKTNYEDLVKFKLSNGESLPTLREYILAGTQTEHRTRLVCEIKSSEIGQERSLQTAEKVVKLIEELGVEGRVDFISFDYDVLKKIIELKPNAITFYLEGDKSPSQLKADGIAGLDYHFSVFKQHSHWIKEAKDNKLLLNAWTVNNAEDMDWLLANKFDLITTDEPELLFIRLAGIISQ